MATHALQPSSVAARSYAHTERIGFGLFMVVAPLIVLGATILHPAHSTEDGTQYYRNRLRGRSGWGCEDRRDRVAV
jgi:hypothetical protein